MLINLLILVIILGLVIYCIQLLPLGQPFKQIAMVIVILIAVLWLVSLLLPFSDHRLL